MITGAEEIEIRSFKKQMEAHQNDQYLKAMFGLLSSYLRIRAINCFLGFDEENKFDHA
jgi:hypothetical protein